MASQIRKTVRRQHGKIKSHYGEEGDTVTDARNVFVEVSASGIEPEEMEIAVVEIDGNGISTLRVGTMDRKKTMTTKTTKKKKKMMIHGRMMKMI